MVYKQNCPPIPPYLGMSLCIKGKKAYKSNGDSNFGSRKSKSKNSTESLLSADTQEKPKEEVGSAKVPQALQGNANSSSGEIASGADKQGGIKSNGSKRRTVDWVRKNIEDLKMMHCSKQLKSSTPVKQTPKKKAEDKSTVTTNDNLNPVCQIELKQFLKEALKIRNEIFGKNQTGNILFVDGAEILEKEFYGDIILQSLSGYGVRGLIKFLQLHGESVQETSGTTKTNFASESKSCPNFSRKFDEENSGELKTSEGSTDSFFSAVSSRSSTSSLMLSCESLQLEKPRTVNSSFKLQNDVEETDNFPEGELDARISRTFFEEVDEKESQILVEKVENVRSEEEDADRKKGKPNGEGISDSQKLELRGRSFESRHQLRSGSNEKLQRHLA